RAVGFYYDEALLDEIEEDDIIQFDLETIYIKFEPLIYEMREIKIVGLEGGTIPYKAYDSIRPFQEMLQYQDIYMNYVYFYSNEELTDLIGYSSNWFTLENLPATIYVDGN